MKNLKTIMTTKDEHASEKQRGVAYDLQMILSCSWHYCLIDSVSKQEQDEKNEHGYKVMDNTVLNSV